MRSYNKTKETTMGKSNKATKADYAGMTSADIFIAICGPAGEMTRGAVSKTIRQLAADGHTTGTIAKMLNKRYQHVRNVLTTPAKKVEETTEAEVEVQE